MKKICFLFMFIFLTSILAQIRVPIDRQYTTGAAYSLSKKSTGEVTRHESPSNTTIWPNLGRWNDRNTGIQIEHCGIKVFVMSDLGLDCPKASDSGQHS